MTRYQTTEGCHVCGARPNHAVARLDTPRLYKCDSCHSVTCHKHMKLKAFQLTCPKCGSVKHRVVAERAQANAVQREKPKAEAKIKQASTIASDGSRAGGIGVQASAGSLSSSGANESDIHDMSRELVANLMERTRSALLPGMSKPKASKPIAADNKQNDDDLDQEALKKAKEKQEADEAAQVTPTLLDAGFILQTPQDVASFAAGYADLVETDEYEHQIIVALDASREDVRNAALEQLADLENVHFSLGLMPKQAAQGYQLPADFDQIVQDWPRVVALGPTGLDLAYDANTDQQQLAQFDLILQAARERELPVLLWLKKHTEQAFKVDFAAQLNDLPVLMLGRFNDVETTELAASNGWGLALQPELTYTDNESYRQIVTTTEAERLLLASGIRLLAPAQQDGAFNRPEYILDVLHTAADLRKARDNELLEQLSENAAAVFGLKAKPHSS